MDIEDVLAAFVQKWEPSILESMAVIQNSIQQAGYYTNVPESDVDIPDLMRWYMLTWQPGRPEGFEQMDVLVAFSLVQIEGSPQFLRPYIEIYNIEGSFYDDIFISDALALDDDLGWENVMNVLRVQDGQVVLRLQDYFPKQTKRKWMIYMTTPEGITTHPSIHMSEKIAKEDVSGKLSVMLGKVAKLFWEFAVLRMYPEANAVANYSINHIDDLLSEGETWEALKEYDNFLAMLNPSLMLRVKGTVGTLTVVRSGGYPDEEVY